MGWLYYANCLAGSRSCLKYTCVLVASFPGPAQLSVACSMKKQGKPGIFSHVSMT